MLVIREHEATLTLLTTDYEISLAGTAVGLKNWIRITFAVDAVSLDVALGRLRSFCGRHSKQL